MIVANIIDSLATTATTCYVALGSNLNNPLAQLLDAIEELDQLPGTNLHKVSSFYQSVAVGPGEQGDYINAVTLLKTRLSPQALLKHLKQIEAAHGRELDAERWTARPLDLDILLYGNAVICEPDLEIPHPAMMERNFVLYPLADLRPHLVFPDGTLLKDLLKQVNPAGIIPLKRSASYANHA